MKFHEKLQLIRKQQGLSQEELGFELQVSRQTVSKWEAGQSYPDFQRLVLLSDYFGMTLDDLVKDIDVQDVRAKNLIDEKVMSIYSDVEKTKFVLSKAWKVMCGIGIAILAFAIITLILKLIFPQADFLWAVGR